MKKIIITLIISITVLSQAYSQFVDIHPKMFSQLQSSSGICFTNYKNGYLLSYSDSLKKMILFRTVNMGKSWVIQNHSSAMGIMFINDSTGFGKGNSLYRTIDYGKSFQVLTNSPYISHNKIEGIYLPTNKDVFLNTPYDGVFKSSDLGNTWSQVHDNMLWSINFINDSIGYATSYINDSFYLYVTHNKGNSWNQSYKLPYYTAEIQFLNSDTAYGSSILGYMGSFNGGKSWDTFPDFTDKSIYDMYFINPTTGFIYDHTGIYKTTDAGESWHFFVKPPPSLSGNQMQLIYENSKLYIYINDWNSGSTKIIRGIFDSTQIWNSTKEIIQKDISEKFKVYPNPAQSKITITYTGFIAFDTKVRIYDIQGKLIKEQQLALYKTVIDIKDFDKGIYFVKIKDGDGVFVEKVVKN
ncbi:MAG: T9SS type A sorting domain-containing protein [Bacteroidota bacterium]|nr:T9SS type A sorting domain-containing protein [Bacteroidota bacterium]